MSSPARLLVIGDIHGAARALTQVLDRAGYDPAADRVIFLGDACDGWSETPEVLDILDSMPDLVPIIGNHDEWFLDWIMYRQAVPEWWHQGGCETVQAYHPEIKSWHAAAHAPSPPVPEAHEHLMRRMVPYHVEDNMVFTHGGFLPGESVEIPPPGGWSWYRGLAREMLRDLPGDVIGSYSKAFIGHTALRDPEPLFARGVWNLDTGAGWSGKLTIMDAYTEDYWQSDLCSSLYPDELGRRG